MILLVLAILAFAVVHAIPAIPRAKSAAIEKLGRGYGPAYGIASLLLLIACIAAFRLAPSHVLYVEPAWGRYANFALTLVAFILAGIFLFRGSWRNHIRYPMALATAFWVAGHLLANGDTRSLVLFGGLGLAAALHTFLFSRLNQWRPADVRAGHNLISVLAGGGLYGVMSQLHGALIGVAVFNLAGVAP